MAIKTIKMTAVKTRGRPKTTLIQKKFENATVSCAEFDLLVRLQIGSDDQLRNALIAEGNLIWESLKRIETLITTHNL